MKNIRNGDLIFFAVIAIGLIAMWALMKRYPSNAVAVDTPAPLPSGLYTSGNAVNGMDTRLRRNFQQQPYGGPTTG